MSVLVDSSVWIDYFRNAESDDRLDWLIDEGLATTNELILAELLPPLLLRRQQRLAGLLRELPRLPLEVDWPALVASQVRCLQKGQNRVGIPDLIIAQNAMQHGASLFTRDRHFVLLAKLERLALF